MRSIGLDFWRCIAIILLLAAHIAHQTGSPIGASFGILNFYFVTLGGLAVTIFLVISGAVLHMQYGGKEIKYSIFMFKRFLRIYPIYYLSLIFSFFIFLLYSYDKTGSILTNISQLSVRDVFFSLTGSYAFAGEWGGPFIATSWFVALIMVLYLFFPFLSRQIKKYPHISILSLLVISSVFRIILGSYEILPKRPLDWFPLCRLFEFSFGIYLVEVLPSLSFKLPQSLEKVITMLSILSFPLFLVHYPLLFIINSLTRRGVDLSVSIIIFLATSLIVSWIILILDKKIPRPKLK